MVNCASENCDDGANYICFCDSNLELLCSNHFSSHLETPMHHSIFHIDKINSPETSIYLCSVLQNNINALNSIKSSIETHIKSLKDHIKFSEMAIDQLKEVQENCESYLSFLLEKMNLPNLRQSRVELYDYAKINLDAFSCIQKNQLEKIFKEIHSNLEIQPIQKLDLSSYNDFVDIVTKISRPVIKLNNSQMQADPLFYCFPYEKFSNFFDLRYKNSDYTLKIFEDTPFNLTQLETHTRLSKNDSRFLKVILLFKSESKLMVLTEKYSHTILNEVYTRFFERSYFKFEVILELFKTVLNIFENESDYKHITPSMIHITGPGTFKIWYPESFEENSNVTTYLSPELYEWKTKGESYEYEKMSAKAHNLYCIALVFLQIMSLEDTSMMYKEENHENLKVILMSLKESIFRRAIIGLLIKSTKIRLTFMKVYEILNNIE